MLGSKVLGIEIGTFNTKIVVGEKRGKKVIIKDFRIFRTPENAFSHDDTLNVSILVPSITEAVKELNCKKSECYVALSSRRLIVRERELPKVNPKDMGQLVQYEAEQLLPYNIDDFVVDYRVIGEEADEEKDLDLFRVMVVAVPKEIINSYTSLIKECSLKLKGINVYPNCIYKYVSLLLDENKNTLIVDIGHKFTKMTIFQGTEYFANINSEIGGYDATHGISQLLAYSMDKSEELKLKHSILTQSSFDLNKQESMGMEIRTSLDSTYNEISGEITRILDFYRTRRYGSKIEQIILLGKGSSVKGLAEYLENLLDIPVTDLFTPPDILSNTLTNMDIHNFKALVPSIGAIIGRI